MPPPLRLLLLGLLTVTASCASYDPYAAYSPEDKAKLIADSEIRAGQKRSEQAARLARDTLSPETIAQQLRSGNPQPLHGSMSRNSDLFDGEWRPGTNPYTGDKVYSYTQGSYQANQAHGRPLAQSGVYQGSFRYFYDPPAANGRVQGTYIMVGDFARNDGQTEQGIYIAEQAWPSVPLHFVRATPGYLAQLETRYQQQVAQFRAEQERLAQESQESSFNFGQILALGLGGLLLASADIPGPERMEIGTALFKDVMSEGQSQALASLTQQTASQPRPTGNLPRPAGNTGGGSTVISSTGARQGAFNTASYSFSCPSGHSSTIDIPYGSQACLSAKQNMARVYSCNLVAEFASVQQQCSQGCGSPQCTE